MINVPQIHAIRAHALRTAEQKIQIADFSAVLQRLILIDGWEANSANEALQQYKRFLFLKKKYGKLYLLPPSAEIDAVWHAHILHTQAYTHFCQQIFGHYLHHHPHFVKASQSLKTLQNDYQVTQLLYFKEFGESLYAIKRRRHTHWVRQWVDTLTRWYFR